MNKHIIKSCWAAAALIPCTIMAQEVKKTIHPGKGLYEIVYSQSADAVYVAGTGARGENNAKVYKLNAQSLAIMDSIDVAAAPAYGLGVNDKTQTLYTTNTRSNSVHAIDLKTNKIVATITNGSDKSHTREVVADEINNRIYVSDVGYGVWVIDGAANRFSHMITDAGKSITGIAINAATAKLYLLDMRANNVKVYDAQKQQVTDSFATGSTGAINLVLDAKTNRLFVSHQSSGEVTVLDAASGKLLKTITAGKGALGINFNPQHNLVYVANRQDGTVTVINAATYDVVKTVNTGSMPNTVAIGRNGKAYVTNKAKSGPRPQPGETPAPAPVDPTGDTVALIAMP